MKNVLFVLSSFLQILIGGFLFGYYFLRPLHLGLGLIILYAFLFNSVLGIGFSMLRKVILEIKEKE